MKRPASWSWFAGSSIPATSKKRATSLRALSPYSAGLPAWTCWTRMGLPQMKDLERSLALREGIRALILANNGEVIETVSISELNRAARSVCLTVRFDHDGGATLEPESSGVSAALGRILAAVVRATDEGTWGRLKVCSNDACQWAFYDRSRNRSGKWCTMEVCGCRMKARTFRQRQASRNGVSHPAQESE